MPYIPVLLVSLCIGGLYAGLSFLFGILAASGEMCNEIKLSFEVDFRQRYLTK